MEEPRQSQIIALEWLAEQTAPYLFLEIPVGGGKSPIGITYSSFLSKPDGDSFILTPQKILQDQYVNSFDAQILTSLYGKNNYPCGNRKTSCDIGSLIKPACDVCPYRLALSKAISSTNVVLNYHLGLSLFAYTDVFKKRKRQLMILDECHTVEDVLTEFNAIIISAYKTNKYGLSLPELTDLTIRFAFDWTQDQYLPAANNYLSRLADRVEPLLYAGDEITRAEAKLVREYNVLQDHVDTVTEFLLTQKDELEDKYVLVFDKTNIKFKPLYGGDNFHQILKPHANQFLFMSATPDQAGLCKDLNLPAEQTAILSLDSEFPKENRRIHYIPQMKMTYTWNTPERKTELQQMEQAVKKIISLHQTESGIIHTANFKIANWLVDVLETYPETVHDIVHHNPNSDKNRKEVIDKFTTSKVPTILISPSITEGLDLIGDLARFAIFAKVPFGSLMDQWIKRRQQLSHDWYRRRAIIDVMQGSGRIVRSKTDKGVTYILDASWGYLYQQMYDKIPKWWKDAYTEI